MAPVILASPAALLPVVTPYKKLLAVLLRQSCVSIAVSNEYLTLAQPVGAVLLRNGQLPERMLARMLAPHAGSITGCVLGHEVHPMHADVLRNGDAQRLLNQLNGLIDQHVSPGLPAAWWDRWNPSCTPSERVLPDAGAAAGAVTATTSSRASTPQGATIRAVAPSATAPPSLAAATAKTEAARGEPPSSPPRCSMGVSFLQHYLDTLGTLNTFG